MQTPREVSSGEKFFEIHQDQVDAESTGADSELYHSFHSVVSVPDRDGKPESIDLPNDVLCLITAFLPLWKLAALFSHPVIRGAAARYTNIMISASRHTCAFWEAMTLNSASQWGRLFHQLKEIVHRYPWCEFGPRWCIGTLISIIEGHAHGRRQMMLDEGGPFVVHPDKGSLRSIRFERAIDDDLTCADRWALEQRHPILPPAPPSPAQLAALSSVEGLRDEYRLLGHRLSMPALQEVEADYRFRCDESTLGAFVRTSEKLRHLQVNSTASDKADVLERVEEGKGKEGRLRSLQTIGVLRLVGFADRHGINRLRNVLVARGCRSLESVTLALDRHGLSSNSNTIDASIIPIMEAVESLVAAVGATRDILQAVTISNLRVSRFDVSLLDELPIYSSVFVKESLKQMASNAHEVRWLCTQQNVIDSSIGYVSETAREVASALTFSKAQRVIVGEAHGLTLPEGHQDPPRPAVLLHLKSAAMPKATTLRVGGAIACEVAGMMASHMPALADVLVGSAVREGTVRQLLQTIGSGRRLQTFSCDVEHVGRDGLTLGDVASELPTIKKLAVNLIATITTNLDDINDAAEGAFASVASLLRVRGLEKLELRLVCFLGFNDELRAELRQLVTDRCPNDVIGRFKVGWEGSTLVLKAAQSTGSS
ncbi:unnamed protein product [Vitrella brassicaformis CCMP3155]|uniref:Uncharacterized protein n=2 Tax=Vitrella brassicaformis TaxID=1169539 RepID=A0A0G4G2B2_VITBC|nr:unnamed protein product [Vitrella brassicaformis CCMP3155]|eukprot:CEM21882.1 unnamed protein product [Vitrella brassicaformis CCMP3155]